MTELAIEASGLVKSFGPTTAVNGVDLTVGAGVVYGFLGPNGAGKTTTIRMLASLLPPDGGSARVLGHDVDQEGDAVRDRVRLTGQFASVDADLTGRENLVLLGRLLLRTPEAVMGTGPAILFPYVFASNLFVEPRTMPGWLQTIVDANPFTHTVTAVRGLMEGTVATAEIGWVLVSSALLVAVFAPITLRLYNARSRN